LTGKKLFVSRQFGNTNPVFTHNNAPLACSKDSEGLKILIDMVLAHKGPLSRTTFGPALIIELVRLHKDKLVISDWPWFFPADIQSAPGYYTDLKKSDIGRFICSRTGGQYPFAMHLWAGGKKDLIFNPPKHEHVKTCFSNGIQVGVIAHPAMFERDEHPINCIVQGLENQGYSVEVRNPTRWPAFQSRPDVMICWNGMREPLCDIVEMAERSGVPVLRAEHGFFDRKVYFQIDHKGILHWASWTKNLQLPAPNGSRERFEKVWPEPIIPIRAKKFGSILVLGQVGGDTQMNESEICTPKKLDELVSVQGINAVFRPHPLDRSEKTRRRFLERSNAKTLKEAVSAARFVIAINSNSCVESLAWGVPVLCLGPATFAQAGVALQTSIADFKVNLQKMLDGWCPEQAKVNNYLYHLASRQYSLDEFRDGEIFNKLFASANVKLA